MRCSGESQFRRVPPARLPRPVLAPSQRTTPHPSVNTSCTENSLARAVVCGRSVGLSLTLSQVQLIELRLREPTEVLRHALDVAESAARCSSCIFLASCGRLKEFHSLFNRSIFHVPHDAAHRGSCIVAVRERARFVWYVVAGTVRSVGYSDSKLHLKRCTVSRISESVRAGRCASARDVI
jgi:hypothetical protein